MNYIRGAVNAISAPYHYYRDLPPINPATLTGAIDVIVVQRPTDDGGTELACSPFHVRFGKWQVLRPGEKKVSVSVNGHPIPFNMKIGDAGEAFFVFETDEDVPEDLITSPILQPTRPDEAAPKDEPADRFGAKPALQADEGRRRDDRGEVLTKAEEERRREEPAAQEPEFLDLDAQPPRARSEDDDADKNVNVTPKPAHAHPPQVEDRQPTQGLPSPPPTPTRKPPSADVTPEMAEQDQRVDAALKSVGEHLHIPEVEYHDTIALDAEGYHAHHNRERSDRTVRSSGRFRFPSRSHSRSATPSPVRGLGLRETESGDRPPSPLPFPSLRATSEPPREADDHAHPSPPSPNPPSSSKLNTQSPVQEYSWEWGAFPQPSPMKTSFGRVEGSLGRSWKKGKAKTSMDLPSTSAAKEGKAAADSEHEHGRSRSVPPELDGSPARDRRIKELVEDDEENEAGDEGEVVGVEENAVFGQGGTLKPSTKDPGRLVLHLEGRKVPFELSVVPAVEVNAEPDGPQSEPEQGAAGTEEPRGRRTRQGRVGGHTHNVFNGRDEVEAARLFAQGKIDFERFLEEEDLVHHPGLVIRWAGNQYVARSDGSPLMRSLVVWRSATLRQKAQEAPSRPPSPLSDEEPEGVRPRSPPLSDEQQPEERHHHRSKSEPPEKPQGKPTSSSWVQWWSRSGRKKKDAEKEEIDAAAPSAKNERPGLRGTASAPPDGVPSPPTVAFDPKKIARDIPPSESAPAYPSTPVQAPVEAPVKATPAAAHTHPAPAVSRKFAKTLRLTSDQLKSLNLKPGANTITFSLANSTTIACTARIFVWDSTDLVVVSDIDGTITKSDGLGHVFAMIGRDWTHLGVAKLYTDITRNGYKIMYLTSRAIGQADATRDYLKGIKQENYQLPEGPVIMSPDRLMASLHREVIMRKPEVFKMACLRDIQRLFGEASRNPFYAGFGNRITDALSYRSVNVPSARIFTIDSSGEVKMELLELAGYKSSYIHMTDLVDQMFPPIHRKWAPEFTDFNYWKPPMQEFPLPDLSPPSPALSARSDTSNRGALSRLRNFSLVPSRQGSMRTSSQPQPPRPEANEPERSNNDGNLHLRQFSSFERLSSTLGFSSGDSSRRSASPESSSSYDSEDDEGEDGHGGRRRERRRSMTSMPGTLDEMHFGMDDDDEEEEPHYAHGGDRAEGEGGEGEGDIEEDAGDEAFDEDLLAAGEMKNVPFL
ncbi:putative LNS2 [Lyophyllum shimeji]|uniref:phosphatidate phosphatase n=1 Tax=Lyophyllum shimeji TaxID=47721 RepID=A0A9P3PEP4_LYOSH|nr:putative LNS2 [Lyophyllum shimeji]